MSSGNPAQLPPLHDASSPSKNQNRFQNTTKYYNIHIRRAKKHSHPLYSLYAQPGTLPGGDTKSSPPPYIDCVFFFFHHIVLSILLRTTNRHDCPGLGKIFAETYIRANACTTTHTHTHTHTHAHIHAESSRYRRENPQPEKLPPTPLLPRSGEFDAEPYL